MRNFHLIRVWRLWGVSYVKSGSEELRLLTRRWFHKRWRGLEDPIWETKVIDLPWHFVLVWGRKSVYDEHWRYGVFMQRFWHEGFDEVDKSVQEEDKSSPRQHCPQKAMLAVMLIVVLRGLLRLRLFIRDDNMMVLIGGCGGCCEESRVRFLMPFKTRLSLGSPFHSMLWRMCQALRADMCVFGLYFQRSGQHRKRQRHKEQIHWLGNKALEEHFPGYRSWESRWVTGNILW